ncbi:MAG: tRNA (adenosine(37)-N6)-threonylcarbamoyltransferase complex transferase subunit TsaD [bacterium]|nr:tRNA (adenosine(37)-N6)-threonylcarbamoyltransferase complex transferase subunit TsaD [bacterium]
MIVLGIETSCDETAVGIVEDGRILHANAVLSSMDLHAAYGGVVPEIAARSHIEAMQPVLDQAFAQAKISWEDIDAIAVTFGAGLGGSLLVGVMTARTLSITKNKPLYACNHVEAHVYANFLTEIGRTANGERRTEENYHRSSFIVHRSKDQHAHLQDYVLPESAPLFPALALVVSGGHSQLVLFRDHFDYTLLGQTRDDAIGEAFDKVAKITGLPYPGGPSVGAKALEGNSKAFSLPKAKLETGSDALSKLRALNGERRTANGETGSPFTIQRSPFPKSYDFSFSGLKTAVLRQAQALCGQDFTFPSHKLPDSLSEPQKADIAAVFQRVAIETVVDKTIQAYEEFQPASVVIAGGVAASPELRRQLKERLPIDIYYQDPKLCTDNGAMIATLGCYKATLGQPAADPYSLEIEPNLSM